MSLRAVETTKRRLVKYGLTLEQFEKLLEVQDRRCAICTFQFSRVAILERCALVIDHDHRTGKVRGLLCGACNTALGQFKDSQERLIAAVCYLKIPVVDRLILTEQRAEKVSKRLASAVGSEIAEWVTERVAT